MLITACKTTVDRGFVVIFTGSNKQTETRLVKYCMFMYIQWTSGQLLESSALFLPSSRVLLLSCSSPN